jgi:Tfp pilus assembly protein PilF
MAGKRIVAVGAILALVLAGIGAAGWLLSRPSRPRSAAVRLLQKQAGYVPDEVCAECHADIADAVARSEMGRSWNTWQDAEANEDRSPGRKLVETSDFCYEVWFEEGKHLQREFRRDGQGHQFETQIRQIAYVMGSGAKGRAYVVSDKGFLAFAPVGWYANKGIWDMSPGYDTVNQRFRRELAERCMSCHNAYAPVRTGSACAYDEPLPRGIGCQRCHGPGAAHVQRRRTGNVALPETIVNPAKLPDDRHQDVCLNCHLAGDVVVPEPGHDVWSFQPGMSLRETRSELFIGDNSEKLKAVGHAPRSMASACYQRSGGRMTCTFCHDPHLPAAEFTPDDYNVRCLECHTKQPCTRPLRRREQADRGNCVQCHMPKQKTRDIPHTAATDHWIQRPGQKLGNPLPMTRANEDLVSFWPISDGQLGCAYIERYEATDEMDKIRYGVRLLETALAENPDPPMWRMSLGIGYFRLGRYREAEKALQPLVEAYSDLVDARHMLALTWAQLGRDRDAIELLEDTLKQWPSYRAGDSVLAHLLHRTSQHSRLLEMEDRVFATHPDDPQRLEIVADSMRRLGKSRVEIEATLERAIAADGAAAWPHLVRASLVARDQVMSSIEENVRAAVLAEPASERARVAYAGLLAAQGRRDDALRQLDAVLKLNPNYRPALELKSKLAR